MPLPSFRMYKYFFRQDVEGKPAGAWSKASFSASVENSIEIPLRRGGKLVLYRNMLPLNQRESIVSELLQSNKFRQYNIQGVEEPRLHFLLHQNSRKDSLLEASYQPGYRYANITMKATPLSEFPLLTELANRLASEVGVDYWNLGVNPVLYRGRRDKMGFHSDDDQGEEKILCVVASSPIEKPRRVIIMANKKKKGLEEGDEKIELFLQPGDAYLMDGEMQKHYVHAVPPEKEEKYEADIKMDNNRIAIVFRSGKELRYIKDSGNECTDISPPQNIPYIFGNSISQVFEGGLYSRVELCKYGALHSLQRGVSGNAKVGCDGIVVSGLRPDGLGMDTFNRLEYYVERRKGAMGVLQSYKKKLPIRIFRSSVYDSPYRARGAHGMKLSRFYRYDGLYMVVSYKNPQIEKGPFSFVLERAEVNERDPMKNKVDLMIAYCQMNGTMARGVRRSTRFQWKKYENQDYKKRKIQLNEK